MDLAKPVQSLIGSVGSIGNVAGGAAATPMSSFGDVLKNTINQTVDAQHKAQELTLAAAQGQPVALQDVVQAVSQAELTLQTLVTVRDRAVEAYQQIMQMPV
ncbi:MAG: flagellar hook-basal body complex protein FliE [Blastochloris viridis]|uniref:Flagellar hook-basal body complex protein FliE n=1 Tax=Blastochloris viridis TaxID=1079 RepID=A0A6N4RF49_BLAVI|nr:MAG: flagellar hook-basal body complex protein FliE [Blastochloris viridis]